MPVRHRSPTPQRLDVAGVSLDARHVRQSPERLGPEDRPASPLSLVHDPQGSWRRVPQRGCALRVRDRVTRGNDGAIPQSPWPRQDPTLPVVLSPSAVAQWLGARTNRTHRTGLMTADAAGLRGSDVRHLRVSDLAAPRLVLRLRPGKAHHEREVRRSPTLLARLRASWQAVRRTDGLVPGRPPDRPRGAHTLQAGCRRARRDSGLGPKGTPPP